MSGKAMSLKTNYMEFVDHYMADDCTALGFEMDCGRAFRLKATKGKP